MRININQKQRSSLAKFFYDLAKIIIAIVVLGNLIDPIKTSYITVILGSISSLFAMFTGFYLERTKTYLN